MKSGWTDPSNISFGQQRVPGTERAFTPQTQMYKKSSIFTFAFKFSLQFFLLGALMPEHPPPERAQMRASIRGPRGKERASGVTAVPPASSPGWSCLWREEVPSSCARRGSAVYTPLGSPSLGCRLPRKPRSRSRWRPCHLLGCRDWLPVTSWSHHPQGPLSVGVIFAFSVLSLTS